MHRTKVRVLEDVLDANATIARANRDDFDRAGVSVVNMMSSPGAGKTTLLERTLHGLAGVRVGVLEGDVAGTLDADRIAGLHIPVTQINTDAGFGGECHLDANMVRSAIPQLPLADIDLRHLFESNELVLLRNEYALEPRELGSYLDLAGCEGEARERAESLAPPSYTAELGWYLLEKR